MLVSILGEDHQEVAACRNLSRFVAESRERRSHNFELSALFEVSTFTDSGANHAQLTTQISLEALFVGSMQAAAVFNHISYNLISCSRFRSIKTCFNLAVNLSQHLAAVGFNQSLLSPVVGIFLHEEAHVAGFIFNLFSCFANLFPRFRRVLRIKSGFFKNFRIVEEYRNAYGIRQTDLLAVFGLCQLQYVRQIIVFHEVFIAGSFKCFVQIGVFKVFSSVVQEGITHLYYVRILAGSHSSLQILCQAFVHIRVIFFYYFNIRMSFVEVGNQFLYGCAAKALSSNMPIFNLYLFAGVSTFLITTAANKCRSCQQRNHCCCQNFFQFHFHSSVY